MQAHFGPKKLYRLEPGGKSSELLENYRETSGRADTVVFTSTGSGSPGSKGPQELLEKILNAAGLDRERRIIIDADACPDLRLRALSRIFPSLSNVVVFGCELKRIGLNAAIVPYAPAKIGDYTVLKAGALDAIGASEDAKRRLWNSIKEMYGL